jgi:hypothetical protein
MQGQVGKREINPKIAHLSQIRHLPRTFRTSTGELSFYSRTMHIRRNSS